MWMLMMLMVLLPLLQRSRNRGSLWTTWTHSSLLPHFSPMLQGFRLQVNLSLFLLKLANSATMFTNASYYGSCSRKKAQSPTRSWWNCSRVSTGSVVKFEAFPLQRLRNNPSKKYSLCYSCCLFLLGTAAVASKTWGDNQHCQLDQRLF